MQLTDMTNYITLNERKEGKDTTEKNTKFNQMDPCLVTENGTVA